MRLKIILWRALAITVCWLNGFHLHAAVPFITNIVLVPRLTIVSDLGTTNQIQYNLNLNGSNWVTLTNIIVTQSPYIFADLSNPTNQRFYRVIQFTNTASGPAVTLTVSNFPSPQTAGVAGSFTVTARDAANNIATSYTGTVHFTSDDSSAGLPSDYTFTPADAGSHTFNSGVTLQTSGTRTITATDTSNGSINGAQTGIIVNPAGAANLTVTASSVQTAGTAFNVTVTAKDAFGNTATGYSGTVHFTTTDTSSPILPGNSTLTAGTRTFTSGATLKTVGTQTITATDTLNSGITGTSPSITVVPGAAASFTITTTAGNPQTAGTAFSVTVIAKDVYGNTATSYSGTVHFTSTDGNSPTLPANSTLTAGVKTFSSGVALKTGGSQTVSATDTVNSGISGTSGSINIGPSAAASFTVTATAGNPQTAGSAFSVTVTAKDAYGNTATSYGGLVTFSSTDGAATLPGNSTLTAGTKTFTSGVTLKTAGSQTVTATDTVTGSITGTSPNITVGPGAAATFTVTSTAGNPQTAGTAFSVTVTAKDAFSNTATSYAGTVHFTSTDGAATLPANSTLTSGTKTFSSGVTLHTTGSQTVSATDTVNSGINGTSPSITVGP